MDPDPALDVTLSNGRQVQTFQVIAVHEARAIWAVVEPQAPLRMIRGDGAALTARARLDTQIAARLAAGWVPLDRRPAGAPPVAPTPVPPDVGLQIGRLLEAVTRARPALRAADPSGQLWAACQVFRQQAWRFGIGAAADRLQRARQERRLGELAEQAGDRAAAIRAYRLALASCSRAGVKRRLAQLVPGGLAASPSSRPVATRVRPRIAGPSAAPDLTGLVPATERSCVRGHAARVHTRRSDMKGRIQIVGRLPVALNRRVRAAARRRALTLNAFLIDALTQALGPRRAADKEAR
jgi:hypothetical protein